MKKIALLVFTISLLSCSTSKNTSINEIETKQKFANNITSNDIKDIVLILASDPLEGRKTGEKGQKIAANYIADFYKHNKIESAIDEGNYLQKIPKSYFKGKSNDDSENVIAFIKGTEKPDEYIVLSAHYDHLGKDGDKVYNGADDDASGTAAVMEIAQAFQKAKKAGYGPKRSIVFIHFTGEEEGLFGSKFYTSNPIFPLKNTIANLNIDMVGRIDKKHEGKPEYIYLIGSDKLSKELHKISENANKTFTHLKLDYTYNSDTDPNRFYYRSDHYNFAKNNIPVIFYFNGTHDDYHKPTDTADKIEFELLTKRAKLVFYTAWELANREEKISLDKASF